MRTPFLITLAAFQLCAGLLAARGQSLPARAYTTADGLVSNFVQAVVRDSRGFLWFCTRGGLSRFDGHSFKNYTTADGLPHVTVNHLLEARNGRYWIATNGGGVVRFEPARAGSAFEVLRVGDTPQTNRVNYLYEDSRGRIWAGTDAGLFRLEDGDGHASFRFVELEPGGVPSGRYAANQITEDGAGDLWVAMIFALARVREGGSAEAYTREQVGLSEGFNVSLTTDATGRLWAAGFDRLCRLVENPRPGTRAFERCLKVLDASADEYINAAHAAGSGRTWLSTLSGVAEFDGERVTFARTGGSGQNISTGDCAEDVDGNLWIATTAGGVLKLTRNGFELFPETVQRAGLYGIVTFAEDVHGRVLAASGAGALHRLEGGAFRAARPPLPAGAAFNWLGNSVFPDSAGDLWVLTSTRGLLRFSLAEDLDALTRARPKAVYGRATGLPSDSFYRAYEDTRGRLWLSTVGEERDRLLSWDLRTQTFRLYTVADGLPPSNPAYSFAEDAAGHLWVGFYDGGVARLRGDRFELYGAAEGFPERMVTALYQGRQGRLWIASNTEGLLRVDDPTVERPTVSARYTSAQGLSSDDVRSIVEDNFGRIYIGTISGINRLDPSTGNVTHFGLDNGLPNDFIVSSFRDSRGALWFGTFRGAVRLVPSGTDGAGNPDPFISAVRAGGRTRPVADLGEREISALNFAPDEGNVQIEFGAVSFGFGAGLHFRYRVEGAGGEWSAPSDQRSVNLSLAPGSYRFVVQAVSSNGQPLGDRTASVFFTVLRPVWQRWWFVAAATALLGLAVFALYRYRVAQLLRVERVRTRIASDLHDDIGASLSQIAVVSEVLRRQVGEADERVGRNLSLMARISREAVDSMSDIVWAINPSRDTLTDLVRRMRRFASETLPNRDIELSFRAPADSETSARVGADFRREVFLIFKEAVNNILKHSGATRAQIDLSVEGGRLVLCVRDDGRGFSAGSNGDGSGGHGLGNMRRRASSLGGALEVVSETGAGTRLTLSVPVRGRAHLN